MTLTEQHTHTAFLEKHGYRQIRKGVWGKGTEAEGALQNYVQNCNLLENALVHAEVKKASDNIDLDVIKTLREKGYTFDASYIQVGEGCTRKALYLHDKNGESFVAKVPKTAIKSSVYAQVNESKGNTNQNEYSLSKELNHKNLPKTLDSITMQNGDVVNIEECLGDSIESPVYGKEFVKISDQIIDGIKYLNLEKKVLHRDIKPDNIVLGANGRVTIIDLQSAKRIEDIFDNALPTRGKAAYAHPGLLNAVIEGKKTSASLRTDAYSVGAVMLYMLNPQGFEQNFQYKIKEDETGIPIEVDGKQVKVSLYANGQKGIITKEAHEARLENALNSRAIMQKHKDIIYKAMTMNEDVAYKNIGELSEDFEKAKTMGLTFKEQVWATFNQYDAVKYGYKKSDSQIYHEKLDRWAAKNKVYDTQIKQEIKLSHAPEAA